MLRGLEESIGGVGQGILDVFREHPKVGGIVSDGVFLGAALAVGVGELALALAGGYVGYRMFSRGESLTEAVEEAVKAEQGTLPKEEL